MNANANPGKAPDIERPILELIGVSKSYNGSQAVMPVDLKIDKGEFLTLLGPSGCGKTSLLRIIAGFSAPSSGRLLSVGEDVTSLRPENRPFNMVFQSYALFPHLNVFDNVAYGLRASGLDEATVRDRVGKALDMVGLQLRRDANVSSLSGGMSQRVALVRAIVMQPNVLLLDEPLAALDLQLRKKMQVELRNIQQRLGTTFVLVTHDQEEALAMSDRIVVMNKGKIEQVGTPREIYHRPLTRFVAEFIGETSLLPCRVEGVSGDRVTVSFANGSRGTFISCAKDAPGSDETGSVSLRPEQLSVTRQGSGMFSGDVRQTVFAGSKTHVTVHTEHGWQLNVSLEDSAAPKAGDRVGVDIVPGAGVYIANS